MLVVYDSIYGNTEQIARAISSALGAGASAVRASDADASALAGCGLLVVGSPTHGGRPSEAMKRFLGAIPGDGLKGVQVAAFDTRIQGSAKNPLVRAIVGFFGAAAPRIEKTLLARGGTRAAPPEGFFVLDREGPLKAGELERAAAWAHNLKASP